MPTPSLSAARLPRCCLRCRPLYIASAVTINLLSIPNITPTPVLTYNSQTPILPPSKAPIPNRGGEHTPDDLCSKPTTDLTIQYCLRRMDPTPQ